MPIDNKTNKMYITFYILLNTLPESVFCSVICIYIILIMACMFLTVYNTNGQNKEILINSIINFYVVAYKQIEKIAFLDFRAFNFILQLLGTYHRSVTLPGSGSWLRRFALKVIDF